MTSKHTYYTRRRLTTEQLTTAQAMAKDECFGLDTLGRNQFTGETKAPRLGRLRRLEQSLTAAAQRILDEARR